MPKTFLSRHLISAGLLFGMAIGARNGFAQDRDTLETKITANGNVLLLNWSNKHPWNAELSANGALLMAEYRTAAGTIALDCLELPNVSSVDPRVRQPSRVANCQGIRSVPSRDARTLQFRLPDTLTATPAGPVCLYIRLPNQKLLPIRKANDRGDDTARFRYEPWEKQAAQRTESATLRARVEVAQRAKDQTAQNIKTQESINTGKGWKSAGACQEITVPELGLAAEDRRPVAAPPDQDTAARRVCIMRVWNAEQDLDKAVDEVMKSGKTSLDRSVAKLIIALKGDHEVYGPPVLAALLTLLPDIRSDDPFTSRLEQAKQFDRDWTQWSSKVAEYKKQYPKPHFGDLSDTLDLQTETGRVSERAAEAILKGNRPELVDIRGLVGASLEAYTRCVGDGKNQLETSYRNATELSTRAPILRENIRRDLIQSCQSGVSKLEALKTQYGILQEELERDARTLQERSISTPLSNKSQVLNSAVCRP